MTDTERKKFAEQYLLKLSEGINPLNNTKLPLCDIVCNPHIANCLKFSAGIIADAVKAEEKERLKLFKKADFQISEKKLRELSFSKVPLSVTEFTRNINQLIDTDRMKKFSYSCITGYLIANGFMEIISLPDNKTRKLPTNAGRELGIFTAERMGKTGPYTAVLYNENAQRFIIDNFDAVLAYGRELKKEKAEETKFRWTDEDDLALQKMMRSGEATSKIAEFLNCSEKEIHSRIKFLKNNNENDTQDNTVNIGKGYADIKDAYLENPDEISLLDISIYEE